MYETAIKKFKNPIPSSYNDRKVVFYVLHTGIQWKELKPLIDNLEDTLKKFKIAIYQFIDKTH